MQRCVSAILARNEGSPDRYLRRVLSRCAEFSEDILLLDDGSTDDTPAIAKAAGCIVKHRVASEAAWGSESPARAELWERGAKLAKDGWLLIVDADMLLVGDPRPLCESWEAAAWAWPLLDLWDSETTFRVDGAWGMGPVTPRPWLFRPSLLKETPQWPSRGLHTGHAPLNFGTAGPCFVASPPLHWEHYGWLRKEHRVAKHTAYMSQAHQLTGFELAHARSIVEE